MKERILKAVRQLYPNAMSLEVCKYPIAGTRYFILSKEGNKEDITSEFRSICSTAVFEYLEKEFGTAL